MSLNKEARDNKSTQQLSHRIETVQQQIKWAKQLLEFATQRLSTAPRASDEPFDAKTFAV